MLLKLLATLAFLIGSLAAYVYIAPAASLNSTTDFLRWRSGLKRADIDVDGIRIAYLDGGKGEPLLLLHGFGGEKDSFARVSRYLTPHYRVIAPDVPGFGESDKPLDIDYSMEAIVDRLHAFVHKLGLKRFALGGNSMGGFIAAAYAVKYADEVSSLWLLAPGGFPNAPQSALARRLAEQGKTLAATTPEEFRELLSVVTAKPVRLPMPWLKVLAARALANQAVQSKALAEIMKSPPLDETAKDLKTQTLIVFGDHDQVVNPAVAEIAHAMWPNSRVKLMHDVGHLPMAEEPEQAAADYLAFRATIAAE